MDGRVEAGTFLGLNSCAVMVAGTAVVVLRCWDRFTVRGIINPKQTNALSTPYHVRRQLSPSPLFRPPVLS